MSGDLEAAIELLKAHGWTCLPPVTPKDAIPEPKVGQVWVSPSPRVEPRTVVWIGTHRTYPWAGPHVVGFTTPKRPAGEWGPPTLPPDTWKAWARKTGARPVETSNA